MDGFFLLRSENYCALNVFLVLAIVAGIYGVRTVVVSGVNTTLEYAPAT
jgi:hypothetical protein